MRVNATLDAEVERHYLDFLRTVEEYLRPKQDRVTVVELSKRISKPPEIDQDFPSFSHALRDDPMGRFEFSGSDDDLAVQLASSHSSTRKATTPLGPQSTISPPKEQGDNITAMDFDIEPIRSVTSSSFICPITQEEMHDPVIAADGFTYERKAIEQWFSKCKRSPSTNNDMRNTSLVPNRILKQIMEDSNQIDVDGVFGPTIRRSCSCPTPACQRWSSTARNSRYPSGGEEGLWVYEVVKDVALAYTSGDDIESVDAAANSVSPISGWVFVQGQLVSSTSRRCNAAGLDVVKLEHGLGWLCAAHLREIQIAPELRVFQVTCEHQLGKRAVPDHRRVFMRSSAGSAVRQGQVLSSSHAVTGKDGAIHLRIDGGWVPDRKFSKGQPVPLMVELDVKESLVVYKVVNKVGLALREWPCHLSAKVEPITTVERDTLVGSRVRVRGEHNEVYIQVEVNSVKGWLFASRDKEVTMQRLSKRPQVYEESPGECVQVQLGPREGSWILLVDEPGEATQTHQWSDITPGLARQITDCKAKGKRIVKFAMSPDGKGWVCEGERPDGTGGHVWSGGLCDELREAMFAEGVDQYALGTDPEGAECGVAWNAHTALWSAHNVGMQDLKDLHKAHAERVCLLPLGQFWAGCESGREFWRLHNKHLEDEIRAMANVLAVAQCPQTGAWLVLSDECFRCSRGLPADLEKQLAKFYARRKAQRAQQQREAALYDAVVARFAE